MTTAPSTPALTDFFRRPAGIALVGASDQSQWSRSIVASIRGHGYDGPMYAVNTRGAPAQGLPGYDSAASIEGPLDAAYVFVPAQGVIGALEDLAAAGVNRVVLLSSGFAETGPAGEQLQREVIATAQRLGMLCIGPNSLGFAHVARGWALAALPPSEPLLAGHVAVVSQSGAICSEIADYAMQQGIGLSTMAAVGNEAQVDVAAMVAALVDDGMTRVIALFVESIRDPAGFARAAEQARAARKPVVVFKVGSSPAAAAVAKAHTGSLVGDDRVFDAVCRRHALVRVHSLEDLVTTAGLLAHTGRLERPGVALVSLSGGGCGVVADLAERHGVGMPAFAPATVEVLRTLLPGYAATLNPFDITGAAVRDPSLFVHCLRTVGEDPSIGLVIAGYSLFSDERRLGPRRPLVAAIGEGLRALGSRGVLASAAVRPYADAGLRMLGEVGLKGAAFGGLEATLRAVRGALDWSQRVTEPAPAVPAAAASVPSAAERPVDERQVLDWLSRHGVPVIPAVVAGSAAEAERAQADLGGAVALKILSPDIAHKTEVGGVRLGVAAGEVAAAHEALLADVRRRAPEARLHGVIVSPMRGRGLELFVGVARDPQWGPVLAVGLGGVWIEVLRDTALALLPLDRAGARALLARLRAAPLLAGHRGAPAADLDALADAIVRIGDAALALGPGLAALEVNPLRVDGAQIEALDGLAVWSDAP